jgi:Fe-S-cluster-containing dehydrogenase component
MKKWNLLIDLDKCNGCFNCFLTAKDEHVGNEFPGYAAPQPLHGHEWISVRAHERGEAPIVDLAYLPVMCNHCDRAPCIEAGKGAVTKRADGIVIIDPVKAKGRKDLVKACPYGAIWWNEEQQLPQAWIFDAHLLDRGWPQPRCVQACGTGAMQAVKIDDEAMAQKVERDSLEVLRPELDTRPRIYYRNLHRANRNFVAGTVTMDRQGVRDVVIGAVVRLSKAHKEIASVQSDAFGEFRIDRLPRNSGRYTVEIAAPGARTTALEFELLDESHYVGEVHLTTDDN